MTRLEKKMNKLGFSQADLKLLTGLSSSCISNLITGKTITCGSKVANLIGQALDLKADVVQRYAREDCVNRVKRERSSIGKKRDYLVLNYSNIQDKIEELGLSRKELAGKLNIGEPTLSGYMTGSLRVSKRIVKGVCEILNLSEDKAVIYPQGKKTKTEELVLPITPSPSIICLPQKEEIEVEPEPEITQITPAIDVQTMDPGTNILPVQLNVCTRCMFENVVNVQINSDFSYPADTIQKWARRSICRMTDRDSVDYNPDLAAQISDMLFNYFVNKKTPLRADARYFVNQKKGKIHLKRDKGQTEALHEYTISRSDEFGNHVTRAVMTEDEKDRLESILRELNVNYTLRDLTDILK